MLDSLQLFRPHRVYCTVNDSLKKWAIAAVCSGVLLVGAIGWRIAQSFNKPKPESAVPLISVVTPTLGEVPLALNISGTINARNDVAVGPEGDGGRISAVLVEVGQRVQRGQVLARIDPVMAESQVAAAEAALEQARATAAAAQADFARAEGARSAFSVEEFERRRTQASTAKAQVNLAEAQLRQSRTRWARTAIVAPTAGIVLMRSAERGQMALPGSSVLFRIAQDAQLEMRGQVAEQDMPRLQVGQPVKVYVAGVTTPYVGQVWQLGAVIDEQSRQGSVRIALPKHDANLRPGAFAHAEVQVTSANGAVVPQSAVLADEHGSFVFVVDQKSQVRRRAVDASSTHPDGILLTSGLTRGDRVVATAGAFLREGDTVHVATR
jgi:HlyD family secretion protein